MASRSKVLTQEKHYKGKLPTKELEDLIVKLKRQYSEYHVPSEIDGFMIVGGDGLTDDGEILLHDFIRWANERGKFVYYHTAAEMVERRNILRHKTQNIWENYN